MSRDSARAVTSSLSALQISPNDQTCKEPQNVEEVVDSWEDEVDSGSDTETEIELGRRPTPKRPSTSDLPEAPPPTPASPISHRDRDLNVRSFPPFNFDSAFDDDVSNGSAASARPKGEERRPDKTTSVASRLIAAGIGQKAPKRTPEQREYDQAMKIQEKKKRDQAKAEEEKKQREREQAQRDIWGD